MFIYLAKGLLNNVDIVALYLACLTRSISARLSQVLCGSQWKHSKLLCWTHHISWQLSWLSVDENLTRYLACFIGWFASNVFTIFRNKGFTECLSTSLCAEGIVLWYIYSYYLLVNIIMEMQEAYQRLLLSDLQEYGTGEPVFCTDRKATILCSSCPGNTPQNHVHTAVVYYVLLWHCNLCFVITVTYRRP